MQELEKTLENSTVVYLARDLERGLGIIPKKGYYIITNSSPFAQRLAKNNQNIKLIAENSILPTHELLQHPEVNSFLNNLTNPSILVFKNTTIIEKICHEQRWKLLNPSAALSAKIEEKISQIEWLDELGKFLPPHQILIGNELTWERKKFIVQFNRAHTGEGTILVESKETVEELKNKFPERPMRLSNYIIGQSFTCNCVVWGEQVLVGPISYQITGLEPFTDNQFATVGNDWSLANQQLKQSKQIKLIAEEVGKKLVESGWRGLYGIDVVVEEKTGEVYLIEINARQPASTSFESVLQSQTPKPPPNLPPRRYVGAGATNGDSPAIDLPLRRGGAEGSRGVSTFEAHLAALLKLPYQDQELVPVDEGAQIVQRVTESKIENLKSKIDELEKLGLEVIEYPNTKPGEDRLRIQSKKGIMLAHGKLNELGLEIKLVIARSEERTTWQSPE